MTIVISGGSGFLGRRLARRLAEAGHRVVILTRTEGPDRPIATLQFVRWNPDDVRGDWTRAIDGADAIVNLAGAGIADERWTPARKDLLRSSRIASTRALVDAIRGARVRPSTFIQGSAVGFYGSTTGDRELDESSPPGNDFLASLCVAWETEAQPAAALGCRLVFARTGIVLAREGGALARLRVPFQFFVGGPVASGVQYMSWIEANDWVTLVAWMISSPAVSGVMNATAPTPVTNETFSRALGRALGRPSWLRVPASALRARFGEMADVALVGGQRVLPRRALSAGFTFSHATIDDALPAALRSENA